MRPRGPPSWKPRVSPRLAADDHIVIGGWLCRQRRDRAFSFHHAGGLLRSLRSDAFQGRSTNSQHMSGSGDSKRQTEALSCHLPSSPTARLLRSRRLNFCLPSNCTSTWTRSLPSSSEKKRIVLLATLLSGHNSCPGKVDFPEE